MKPLTEFQARTLKYLAEHRGGAWHEDLYPVMFPNGRFIDQRDSGSAKGGPSRVQCAVNWHLGRMGGLVEPEFRMITGRRRWFITAEGRRALREASMERSERERQAC